MNMQVYDYFSYHHGTCTDSSQQTRQLNPHKPHYKTTLANLRQKKNDLKKQFRAATKHRLCPEEDLVAMGKAFHDVVKQHNKLRREVLKRDRMRDARYAIKQCSKNFWKFTKKLLSEDANNTQPSFSAAEAFDFFSKTYTFSDDCTFSKPPWMQDVPNPNVPYQHDRITFDELLGTIKKCRCGSSPNPLDGIAYTILKRCPSLHPALICCTSSTPA
jgi:hypothetical protein